MADGIRRIDVYPDDWLAATYSMSLEHEGAYWRVCCLIYSHGGPIDDDDRMMALNMRISTRRWRTIKTDLVTAGKITIEGGKIGQKRAENELNTARKRIENYSKRGKQGAQARWNSEPNSEPQSNENNGDHHTTSNGASNASSNAVANGASNASRARSTTTREYRRTPKKGSSEYSLDQQPPPAEPDGPPAGGAADRLDEDQLLGNSGELNDGAGLFADPPSPPINGATNMVELLAECGVVAGSRLASMSGFNEASYALPGGGRAVVIRTPEVKGQWPDVVG